MIADVEGNISNGVDIFLPEYSRFSTRRFYHKIYNIRWTKSQNLNDSPLVLQLSLPNPLKPGIKSRMKM